MDYASWYEKVSAPFRGAAATMAINVLDKALVYLIAAAYLVLIAFFAVTGNDALVRFVLVPAVTFVAVTAIRAKLDRPRPYEQHGIDPIIVKSTHGKSSPSRHVASAVAIACAIAYVHAGWGALAFAACAVVAFTRIVGGVHYPRDVAFAAMIAGVLGIVGFVLIP